MYRQSSAIFDQCVHMFSPKFEGGTCSHQEPVHAAILLPVSSMQHCQMITSAHTRHPAANFGDGGGGGTFTVMDFEGEQCRGGKGGAFEGRQAIQRRGGSC